MEMMEIASVEATAWNAFDAGLRVLPPKEDGSKAPITDETGGWKYYQQNPCTPEELRYWYEKTGRSGVGIVCGEIEEGYLENTPTDTFHWFYRCSEISGNTKLAVRPKAPEEMRHPEDKAMVLIETRGHHGYAITAPSNGKVHPTGKPYTLLRGGFDSIATITPEERAALWELARTFDQMPKARAPEGAHSDQPGSGRPGDDYNAKANWDAILSPQGWTSVYQRNEITYWRRPGKDFGVSATTNYQDSGLLYVFSTSTGFNPEQGYSPFAAYTLLEHSGDFSAAARTLFDQGYGDKDLRGVAHRADRRVYFQVPSEAKTLLDEGYHFAKGGDVLYVFQEGVYKPAKAILRNHLIDRLQGRWTRQRVTEILTWLCDASPGLWERPPIDKINLANGILNIDTGELESHTPEFLSPIQLPVRFDSQADCPKITSFISEVLPKDVEALGYEVPGHLAVPDTKFQKAVLFKGSGGNGKSTLLALIEALVGPQNVSHVSLQDLGGNRFAGAELYGKLANICADLSNRSSESSSLFKQIVGGDRIRGERKYGPGFYFRPFSRLMFSANEIPASPDVSHAYQRRWIIIPFPNRFEDENEDREILEKLTQPGELSGYLNMALVAYLKVVERGGFTSGESTERGKEELREAIDPVVAFAKEALAVTAEGRADQAKTYKAYQYWAKVNGRRVVSARKFNGRLAHFQTGVELVRVNGYATWKGIQLMEDAQDWAEAQRSY